MDVRPAYACPRHFHPTPLRRAGIFQLDAMIGLVILVVLGTAFTVAVSRQRSASDRMADQRGATWAAEHALAQLQARRPVDKGVKIEPVAADGTPVGYAWIRVSTALNGRAATLLGLVPAAAVPPDAVPTAVLPAEAAPETLPSEGGRP